MLLFYFSHFPDNVDTHSTLREGTLVRSAKGNLRTPSTEYTDLSHPGRDKLDMFIVTARCLAKNIT